MQGLNVNLSSEFMVLAAELLRIKSKMMLPKVNVEEGRLIEEDPRDELVSRILEYKKCKAASEYLEECQGKMEDIFEKPQEDISEYLENPDEYLSIDINQFAKAFKQFLHRRKKLEDTRKRYTIIQREHANMESRMIYIKDLFIEAMKNDQTEISFDKLIIDPENRYDVVTSFLSVLQMARDRYLDIEQNSLYGEIIVKPGKRDLTEYKKESI